MANPTKANSQLADASGDPMIGQAQTLVADMAAITAYSAPLAAQAVTVVSEAATDLDDAAAALETLRDEVAAMRLIVNSTLDILEAHGLMKDA